jgi:uncharacterized membrane protein YeaQ/YmgE (transglycosylase-associated protein family)
LEPRVTCGVDQRLCAKIDVTSSPYATCWNLRHAHCLGDHHWFCRWHYRALSGAGPNNPAGFILTTLLGIGGAFIATFIGQAIGWYGQNEGAGIIGAVVGALVVLFIWHRLVSARVIPDPADRRWL